MSTRGACCFFDWRGVGGAMEVRMERWREEWSNGGESGAMDAGIGAMEGRVEQWTLEMERWR